MPELTVIQACILESLKKQDRHICQVTDDEFETLNSLLVHGLVTRRSVGYGVWSFKAARNV
jgi:phage major head subunit gpT-like protein